MNGILKINLPIQYPISLPFSGQYSFVEELGKNIIKIPLKKEGDFKMALSWEPERRGSSDPLLKLEYNLSLSRDLVFEFEYEFAEGTNYLLLKKYPADFFKEAGISLPNKDIYVFLENPAIAEWETQIKGKVNNIGWWDSDFGGYGSYLSKPLDEERDVKISTLAYLARDVKAGEGKNHFSVDYIRWCTARLIVDREFDKYKGKTITHAEGNYPGRAGCRSWNTGLKGEESTKIYSWEDLIKLAYVGMRVLKIH